MRQHHRLLLAAAAAASLAVTGASTASASAGTHQVASGTEYIQIMSASTTAGPASAIAEGVFGAAGLAYLGDAEIGAGTNIGAGVITCNYDGVHKHVTRIGEGVFVGSDSTLVAPIAIEDGAYIGAGSCITKDVPAGALSVGRGRQVTKEGWAEARRARRKAQEQG